MSFIEQINALLSMPEEEYAGEPRFKPSMLGTPCLRKLYYSFLRVPKDFPDPPTLKKYASMGNYAHDRISEYLRKRGMIIDYYNPDGSPLIRFGEETKEFPLKDKDLNISMMIDAVAVDDGKLWLGEWKTIGDRPFAGLGKPKPEHYIQGILYFYLFNRALSEGVYQHIKELDNFTEAIGIRWLYENRNTGDMKEFESCGDPEAFKQVVMKMEAVKEFAAKKICPPKTMDWCKSCPWRAKCARDHVE